MSVALQNGILFSCDWRTAPLLWKLACRRTSEQLFLSRLGWVAGSIIFFMLQRRKLSQERGKLLQSVSGRGSDRTWVSWPRGVSPECTACFWQRWQSSGPGSAGRLKSSALPQAREADICLKGSDAVFSSFNVATYGVLSKRLRISCLGL